MRRRAAGSALGLALSVALGSVSAGAPGTAATAPKPLQPARTIKPESGYFDDVFAVDAEGRRLAAVRTDGATFAKLEVFDLAAAAAAPVSSIDLPTEALAVEALYLVSDGKGIVVIARQGTADAGALWATLLNAAGREVAHVGPAVAFGRPPEPLLVALDRRSAAHGAVTYTVTPYALETLAPAGKPRTYQADGEGMLKAPPARLMGFFRGYTRAVVERPGAYDKKTDVRGAPRTAVLETLAGKLTDESEIADVMAWAAAVRLRAEHPDRGLFAALNPDDAGVDIVDAMGKRVPAELAIPFRLYEPKSLRDQEGPEPGTFRFSLAIDPLNPDALKRRKADLPMLDLYAVDPSQGSSKLRARVFVPRPVTWRAAGGRLVVLKRFKSFTRGGDELQIYDVR
jgi:hypothetical protein